MATPHIKATYSLDVETVRTLETLAQRWGIAKSAALRRVIQAAGRELDAPDDALVAFEELQRSVALDAEGAAAWADEVRAERRASRP